MSGKPVTFSIDGREVTVPAGTLVIRAAEQLGIYIPRFCDHPLLDPLGACRQCLVEVEGQRKPLTACTTTATEGMVVKTQWTSDVAADGQAGVLELLLINHPLDCPMCDKGGECPLQDQALAYGPGGSRFVEPKRRFVKPIPISSLINLDRERCVLCARCTRFAAEISGDPFIELFERGALEQVAIDEDQPYDSIFSGNVVQICPVGALTSRTFRFKARPFDVVTTPSTCNRCASGCAIDVQHRRGEIVRILARDDGTVNDEWLCDKGRFAYAYAHHPQRLTEPMVRKDDQFVSVSWTEALETVAARVREVQQAGARIVVRAGEQLLDEDAYALSRFARTVLRTDDVDARRAPVEGDEEVVAAIARSRTATNEDIDAAALVVTVGVDLHEESPIVYLRVRKNMRKRGLRVHELGAARSRLAELGAGWSEAAPGEEAGVLRAAAAGLEARGDSGLDPWTRAAVGGAEPNAELAALLGEARGSVVVLAGERLSPEATALAWNLSIALGGRFGWVPRKAGARGAVWAGLRPGLRPGGRRAGAEDLPAEWDGITGSGDVELLWLVASDPVRDVEGGSELLGRARFVVAQDLFLTESSRRADVLLPAAAAYERSGTITNWEGRAREVGAAVPAPGLAQTDLEILAGAAAALGELSFPATLEAVRAEMRALAREPQEPRAVPVPTTPAPRPRPAPPLLDDGTMMLGADALRASARAET